jgi:hypothetical protein
MSRRALSIVVVVGGVLCAQSPARGQVTLSGSGVYIESFDGIGSGVPPGWSVQINATATRLGTDVSTSNFASTPVSWGSTTGQFGNYASALNPNVTGTETATTQSGYTNRALGVRQTSGFSGFGDPSAAFTLHLANTTGYKDFNLSFSAQLLSSQPRSTTFTVRYGTGASPSSFTTVGTISTDSLGNGTFGSTLFGPTSLGGINDSPNAVWIQVAALNGSTGSGNDDTFAIDDVQLTYSPVPEPATVGLVAAAGLGAAALVRRPRRAKGGAA